MSDLVRLATQGDQKANSFPDFASGDTISVSVKVKEGEKERVQIFKGVVLKIQGAGPSRTFTVRKVSEGIGVERTFPYNSPSVEKVEVQAHGKTRRSRLFFLRNLKGRAAKVKSELAGIREQRQASQDNQKS